MLYLRTISGLYLIKIIFFCLIFVEYIILPQCFASDESAKNKFFIAQKAYNDMLKNSKEVKYRENWISCIQKFQEVYKKDPNNIWASAGMYKVGELYLALYKLARRESDKIEAVDIFYRVIKRFPTSKYSERAKKKIDLISKKYGAERKKTSKKVYKKKFSGKKKFEKQAKKSSLKKQIKKGKIKSVELSESDEKFSGTYSIVNDLRFWSNPDYTRVVIDANKTSAFHHRLLKKDPSINKSQRLYVDLSNSKLGKNIKKNIPINDDLLENVRAGQYTLDTVRVVIDIKSFKDYKIFSLRNPFRIVIDVWSNSDNHIAKTVSRGPVKVKGGNNVKAGALTKQLALGVRTIVIDPGHGGRDYGAPGAIKGVHEKYIVLALAKKLAKKIRQKIGCEVLLTRSTDKFLTLEERTAFANTKRADLFISIHTNAARTKKAYGTETYFLNLATDEDAIDVAARENATSAKNISDLQAILNDLMQNAKINESTRLASYVQRSICSSMKKKYSKIRNKGVKKAPFYVLLGARMPAILIETAFISNPRECKRLINKKYQNNLCNSMLKGIMKYIKETNPRAIIMPDPKTLKPFAKL